LTEGPREKIVSRGVRALEDSELLAAILGSGTKVRGVKSLAADLLKVIDGRGERISFEDLYSVQGVGQAKACLVLATLEFARRRIRPQGVKITQVDDVLREVHHLATRKQEHFVCISLNGAHEVIITRVVSVGLVNMTQVHPREVFADPLMDRACAVILAHNHPSGDCTPSTADKETTQRICKAGELLGIRVLDHVIFSDRTHFSFQAGRLL
jgi:DNA repair protein RadC